MASLSNTFMFVSFQVPYFTHYMIAIINNCLHAMELVQEMKTRNGSRCDQSGSSAVLNKFENLAVTYDVFHFTCEKLFYYKSTKN